VRSTLRIAAAGLVLIGMSCSSSSSSNGPTPTASTLAIGSSLSIKAASPAPSPATAVCRYGNGTLETECRRRREQFEADVNAAIDRLAERHPEYFDIGNTAGPGEWRVLQPHTYLAGVVDELRTAGFCAETDESFVVSVKNGNDLSEDYNVLLPTDHVQRGNRV